MVKKKNENSLSGNRPYTNNDLVTKKYVDSCVTGIDWNRIMKMKERKWKMEKILSNINKDKDA